MGRHTRPGPAAPLLRLWLDLYHDRPALIVLVGGMLFAGAVIAFGEALRP